MTALKTIVPFRQGRTSNGLRTTGSHDPFERLFDSFFHNALTGFEPQSAATGGLRVDLDISETEKAYHVTADLPGIEDKDVEVTLSEGVLTIAGERMQEEVSEDKNLHRTERRYGAFKRSLVLPSDVNEKKIAATMRNGVLQIDIEKMPVEEPKSKRIAVKTA